MTNRQPKWTPVPRENMERAAEILGSSSAAAQALAAARDRYENEAEFFSSDDGHLIVLDARSDRRGKDKP